MGVNVGGLDHAGAAAVYAVSTAFSWAKTLAIPGIQALANIKLLERQNKMFRDIRSDQRQIVTESLDHYVTRVNALFDDIKDAYPDVPKAARYVPVDPCKEQYRTITCNASSGERANDWAQCINRLNNQSDIARMVFFDPRWVENVDLYAVQVSDLLRGRLPVDFTVPLLADAVELSAFEARNGTARPTARGLGMSRLRMQATGRDELVAEADMLERVSPMRRQVDMRDMMQTPQQRVALALTQAQLVQNSLQNLFNRNAEKPPYRMAQLSLRLERAINFLQVEASRASLINASVPNYAAILQPQIHAITNSLGSMFSSNTQVKAQVLNPYTDYPVEREVIPTK